MVEEGYDLVIRVNPDPDESLVGRVFLRDRLVVVASPALVRPADGSAVPAVVRGAGDRTATWDVTTPGGRVEHRGRAGPRACHRSSWSAMPSGPASAPAAFRSRW